MQFIYKFEAMSAPCEIHIFELKKTRADRVAELIVQEAKRLEKKYNYFDSNSYLSKINARQERDLDPESKSLLQRSKRYYNLTNGIFDITMATIKDLYMTSASLQELEERRAFLLPYVGCNHFEIKRDNIIFDNEFTKIDLGGFVKEYAVDRAVQIIKKNKIKSALVNFGGDIFAIGKKPNGDKFKIGIKNPLKKDEHIEFVEVENEALTTSASYERSYNIELEEFSHILSKQQNQNRVLSVTVISDSCVQSGVYSTSLMVDKSLKTKNKTIIIDQTGKKI